MTSLSLYEDLLGPGERRALPAGNRVVYVASGALGDLHVNQARFSVDPVELDAGDDGATVLRWELTERVVEDAKLWVRLELDPGGEWVLRCDRVDFPPGSVAYRHTHPGPGIRCLLAGSLRIDGPDGLSKTYGPFDAWFEGADHPVLATASESTDTFFVRVLLLPAEWRGQRTIRYADPADEDKPKLQQATVFLEESVDL